MPLGTILAVQMKLLEALHAIDTRFTPNSPTKGSKNLAIPLVLSLNFFQSRQAAIQGLASSAEILQKRIHGVLALVGGHYLCLFFMSLIHASLRVLLHSRTRKGSERSTNVF